MKEKLKSWFRQWWEIDYQVLDEPDGYSCASWIVFQTLLMAAVFLGIYVWNKDFQIEFNRVDLLACAFVLVFIAAFVYVFIQINKSIAERKVFTKRNARLFIRLSNVLSVISILSVSIFSRYFNGIWVVLLMLLSFLASMALQTAGWMINKGIQMQEEQELTI